MFGDVHLTIENIKGELDEDGEQINYEFVNKIVG